MPSRLLALRARLSPIRCLHAETHQMFRSASVCTNVCFGKLGLNSLCTSHVYRFSLPRSPSSYPHKEARVTMPVTSLELSVTLKTFASLRAWFLPCLTSAVLFQSQLLEGIVGVSLCPHFSMLFAPSSPPHAQGGRHHRSSSFYRSPPATPRP